MKVFLTFCPLILTLSALGKGGVDSAYLAGEWKCHQEFQLSDSVIFSASHTSKYSLSSDTVVSNGIITTYLINKPGTKSVLQVQFHSHYSIDELEVTFKPYEIEATVLENGLGDLTEEFVDGFMQHKVESSADLLLIDESNFHLKYRNGTSAECLRA
ncbi:hypothetical protein [Alteromonas oceanisediminis]|uniref:hypothetical protein n=1 Tax=Alteromonas oceanisediminis TaxID=2836180 RepID=UPI001BD93A80|nr:hypothetical protein [Alteromonas oceanisediminis]MBT0584790.1 hypothetical protein [Alteromonas oceanisediminis]